MTHYPYGAKRKDYPLKQRLKWKWNEFENGCDLFCCFLLGPLGLILMMYGNWEDRDTGPRD